VVEIDICVSRHLQRRLVAAADGLEVSKVSASRRKVSVR
jgi:hypothetical protein